MTTRFSDLDLSNQKIIAEFVSHTFLRDVKRTVSADEVIRLFHAYDIEVDWSVEGSFEIRSDEKLELAIKHLMGGT